jgi:two-component system OmpR family sensor kinase
VSATGSAAERPGPVRSLSSRLLLAMTGVAVLGAVLAGVLTAPLLTGASRDAVRAPLAQQAELLSRLPPLALRSERLDVLTAEGDVVLGLVSTDGSSTGVASALDPAELEALAEGRPVSTRVRYGGELLLVEARPTRDGGAVAVAKDVRLADAVGARQVRRVVLAIGLGLVVAVLAATLLARRLARPLAETATAARRLAAGERGVPVPRSSTREVAEVATALGGLDTALTTSERRQRDFLRSVSHELRTPLTTIHGYAEGLADRVVGPDEAAAVGRTLLAEAERMERYVADLLALSRLEADDFSLELVEVDVADLVESTAGTWRDRAARAGVTVDAQTSPGTVVTDPTRLRQVLDVLLDNAVRVCAEGDRVVLEARAVEDGVRVEVRDSGPGLTQEEWTVAFEPGALHERHPGRAGGAGLGLAIAHRLVQRLGGTVEVGAAPEGGARFVVRLTRRLT